MEGKHPKRKRDKYNPYYIYEKDGQTFIAFEDGQGDKHRFGISRELYEAFDKFELEDLRYLNEISRHTDFTKLTEQFLESYADSQEESIEEAVFRKFRKKQLHKAMGKLPKKQKRRLILHYFYDMTYKEIAEIEGCSVRAVEYSMQKAVKALKKIYKKIKKIFKRGFGICPLSELYSERIFFRCSVKREQRDEIPFMRAKQTDNRTLKTEYCHSSGTFLLLSW